MSADDPIRHALLALASERGVRKTFCPSEAARWIDAGEWREQLDAVRASAAALVDEGRLECLQRGRIVHPVRAEGPIRLRIRDG